MELFSSIRSRSIKLTSKTSTNQESAFSRSNTASYGSLYWTFDPNNHRLSEGVAELLYHKWMFRACAITWILVVFVGNIRFWHQLFYVVRCVLFTTPYYIMLILSFNKDACGFIMRSSEFWIKICYAAVNGILRAILYHQVGRIQLSDDLPEWLGYTYYICALVSGPLFLAVVGGMDAIPKMPYKWKCSAAALVAIVYTGYAIHYQFTASVKDDYIIEVQATDSLISFHSILANVNGMLAMFLWKQVIDVVRNRDRCIAINYRPYLRWEPTRPESELVESEIPENSPVALETSVN